MQPGSFGKSSMPSPSLSMPSRQAAIGSLYSSASFSSSQPTSSMSIWPSPSLSTRSLQPPSCGSGDSAPPSKQPGSVESMKPSASLSAPSPHSESPQLVAPAASVAPSAS